MRCFHLCVTKGGVHKVPLGAAPNPDAAVALRWWPHPQKFPGNVPGRSPLVLGEVVGDAAGAFGPEFADGWWMSGLVYNAWVLVAASWTTRVLPRAPPLGGRQYAAHAFPP
ncbi:hypothetical protein GWK47_030944 [Chionoecetes opilio]|uniref:Uncharacterized protein n=1 Tax=Chionoecetes opilio TaxID=41210 RepID=A0A8J4YVD9_CHIOP|nr:hypothetical protein GWK47_030944 [Chionoecetes opilio]